MRPRRASTNASTALSAAQAVQAATQSAGLSRKRKAAADSAASSARDTRKPKRAMTAFLYYCLATRPQVVADNPGMAFAAIGKRLGVLWTQVGPEDRAEYEMKAVEDKERFLTETRNYVPSPHIIINNRRGRNSSKSDTPRRVMSAYLYFCQQHRGSVKAEFPELKMVAIQAKLGELWRETSAPERGPYQQQANADRARLQDVASAGAAYQRELNAAAGRGGDAEAEHSSATMGAQAASPW